MRYLADAALAAAAIAYAVVAYRREPRRWRIGAALTVAAWAVAAAVLDGVEVLLDGTQWGELVVFTLPWALSVVVGVVLILNGLRMVRPEGRTLGNLLPFLLGVAMTAATVVGVALFWFGTGFGDDPALFAVIGIAVLLLPGYPAVVILSYLLYCLAYARRRPRAAPEAVVVLGSGLAHGRIPPLLAGRLDAAVAVMRAEAALGRRPLLVPSGGQGEDEPLSEAAAMAAYLAHRGIDCADIVTEDRSTTTEENLDLSRRLLLERGIEGRLQVVTSSYHVGRAALITRRLGIDADVTAAPTAWYFLPSAFLRETAAAVTYRPAVNVAGVTAWTLLTAYVAWRVVVG